MKRYKVRFADYWEHGKEPTGRMWWYVARRGKRVSEFVTPLEEAVRLCEKATAEQRDPME